MPQSESLFYWITLTIMFIFCRFYAHHGKNLCIRTVTSIFLAFIYPISGYYKKRKILNGTNRILFSKLTFTWIKLCTGISSWAETTSDIPPPLGDGLREVRLYSAREEILRFFGSCKVYFLIIKLDSWLFSHFRHVQIFYLMSCDNEIWAFFHRVRITNENLPLYSFEHLFANQMTSTLS